MKKKTISLLLICAVFITSAFSVSAALSPAIEVLSYESNSVKAGLYNCDVVFTETDFCQAVGLTDFGSITITSAPPAEDGALYIGNTVLEEGQTVSSELLSHLIFRAASAEIDTTEFSYTLPEKYGTPVHTCKIVFLDKINQAPTATVPTSAPSLTTYKNISLYSCLSATDP